MVFNSQFRDRRKQLSINLLNELLLKMKNLLYITIPFFCALSFNLNGQSITTFEQDPADNSDYFININWEVNLNISNCDCVPNANTKFILKQNFGFGLTAIDSFSNPSTNPWSGSYQANWHPGWTVGFGSQLENPFAKKNFL